MTFDARREASVLHPSGGVVHISPGSGPVDVEEGVSVSEAVRNLLAFAQDLQGRGASVGEPTRRSDLDEDGRFTFILPVNNREVRVDMPGLPLKEVRWLGQEDGSPWNFPRLYIDESSWLWKYALNVALDN